MKKTILFLLILFSIDCTARTFFDILINDPLNNSELSSFFEYDDLYFYENSDGVKKYLNRKSAGINFNSEGYFIEKSKIRISKWDFFWNDLNALKDRIKFESESIEISLNSEYKDFEFGFSSQLTNYDILYDIDVFSGNIPISYFQFKTNIKYKNLKLDLTLINGNESEDSFSNKIKGYSSGLLFDTFFKNINFSIQGNYRNFSVNFRKDNSKFCELNGIQFLQYFCFGKYNLHSYNSVSSGVTGIRSWQRERSFFDAEPFINYYSLFFGSKTFIKKMDFNAILPFISYDHKFRFHRISFSTSIDYYHIFTDSDIIYTERKWLIPGIWPDDSTKHKLDIEPDIDGIFHIKLRGDLVYKKFLFGIAGSQLLPVDYSKLTRPQELPPSEKKANERGGTYIAFIIGYLF